MNKTLLYSAIGLFLGGACYVGIVQKDSSQMYMERESNSSKKDKTPNGAYFNRVRSNPKTGVFDHRDMINAAKNIESKASRRSSLNINWNELGPNNIGGRTRAILIDKDDSDHLLAGSATGGLFVSHNAGGTWEPVNDLMQGLAISAIDQSPNGDIYVGTGCSFDAGGFAISAGASKPGSGVFKSTDGGVTFTQLASTTTDHDPTHNWAYVNRIKVDPKNPLHVYAGTGKGLMVSTDGGNNWTNKQNVSCGVISGVVDDVEFSVDGRLFAVMGGKLLISDNPSADLCTDYTVVGDAEGWTGANRIDLTVCKSNPDQLYAIRILGGELGNVIESNDGGEHWQPATPGAPSIALDSSIATLFNGQGLYDLVIEVYPDNCDQYIVGGVELYRAAPNWYKAASNSQAANDFYVHADKHFVAFDPNNSNVMYIGSDGGVGKSTNALDQNMNFIQANRGYNVTQFYGMAFSANGIVIAGAQDNGTILVDPSQPGTFMDGREINGGDGFDCEISNIGQAAIVTSQYGTVNRVDLNGGFDLARNLNDGPFNSVVRLWESKNDLTSKDSVVFRNDSVKNAFRLGNGITRIFSGQLQLTQPNAKLVDGTVAFEDLSFNQLVEDFNDDGILEINGDSVGTYDKATRNFTFKFPVAPADQSQIFSKYNQEFNAGDSIFIISATANSPIVHVLQNDLNVNDSLKVQDTYQAVCATVSNSNIFVTRDILHFDRTVRWIRLNDSEFGGITGIVTSIEYTEDGNVLFAGTTAGVVYRYEGLNNLYHGILDDDVDEVISRTTIFTESSRDITGICAHPNDSEKLMITLGNYLSGGKHVFEVTNALSATGLSNAVKRDVTGDLIDMPVYDAEYSMFNDKVVIIGTDFGVWSTPDVNASNVEWFVENPSLANVPVTDIRQQRMGWEEASNHGQIYLATYGRGMWKTDDFVSVEDVDFIASKESVLSNMIVFPNPVAQTARVRFDLDREQDFNFRIFDLTGKVVKQYMGQRLNGGESYFEFNVNELPGGTYFISAETNGAAKVSKFVVVK